jgi:serine/threonine protein kinase
MSERKPDLKRGDHVGVYELLDEIGRGSFAVVYQAQHRILNRQVAINFCTSQEEAILALARREAEILASVNHPHIVSLYDAGEHQGYFYQVLEYVAGTPLSRMVASEDELPITVVVRLMIGLADALDHLHGLGYVHGDIKPSNIILSSSGVLVLVGHLSLSGRAEDGVFAELVVDLPPYTSPEGWRNRSERRSDLWAFGMTLCHLLTGRLPFDTRDGREVERIIVSSQPLDLSFLHQSVPAPVARIVERCLQKDLEARYQEAAEIRRDLESALAYLESGMLGISTGPLRPGSAILLNVEYIEPGIPDQYREYRIKREVGQGSFSIVYSASDVIGKRPVALKILRQERMDDEKILVRFRREAALLARLRHPNIVRVFNFGQLVADLFIVMELLGPVTIETALDGRFEFQVDEAVAVVAQLLQGLEMLHAEGVVHRDVKPANVMIEPERAVVMDLGLAHISDRARLTSSGEIFGTPRYMAPEQARGEGMTVQSDLYAAGVLLYEMLTGRIPHEADSTAATILRIALEEPEPVTQHREDLPPGLVAFLDRALAREPAERFASARLAREALLASAGLQSSDLPAIHRQMFEAFGQSPTDSLS